MLFILQIVQRIISKMIRSRINFMSTYSNKNLSTNEMTSHCNLSLGNTVIVDVFLAPLLSLGGRSRYTGATGLLDGKWRHLKPI